MHGNLTLPLSIPIAFVLVLARVAGTFAFVPLPGMRSGPDAARVVLSVAVTLALFPKWPAIQAAAATPGNLSVWLLAEAAFGIAIGVVVSFTLEAFVLAAQIAGLPAGFGYASTIDPTTQADASVLMIFAQLAAGLTFFMLGLEGEVVRIFARSLEVLPPGAFALDRGAAERILSAGTEMFVTGLRLALPVVGLMLLVDLSLALLGRLNAHLQLLTLALPLKMLLALVVMGAVLAIFPAVQRQLAGSLFGTVRTALSL